MCDFCDKPGLTPLADADSRLHANSQQLIDLLNAEVLDLKIQRLTLELEVRRLKTICE